VVRKHDLREQQAGTVINMTSKKQETALGRALAEVVGRITGKFGVELEHRAQWKLVDIVSSLRGDFHGSLVDSQDTWRARLHHGRT